MLGESPKRLGRRVIPLLISREDMEAKGACSSYLRQPIFAFYDYARRLIVLRGYVPLSPDAMGLLYLHEWRHAYSLNKRHPRRAKRLLKNMCDENSTEEYETICLEERIMLKVWGHKLYHQLVDPLVRSLSTYEVGLLFMRCTSSVFPAATTEEHVRKLLPANQTCGIELHFWCAKIEYWAIFHSLRRSSPTYARKLMANYANMT